MVLQLAYFRMHGKACATYETASTRRFHHGRTETCRSCSKESLDWTKSMTDKNATNEMKIELLKKAVEAHKSFMLEAVKGRGCDRHLFGLVRRLMSLMMRRLRLIAAEEMRDSKRTKMPGKNWI